MKIAITGKGGVGKSTLSALLVRGLKDKGHRVLAVDADPDMNLGTILGVPSSVPVTPIIEFKELIAERTETEVGKPAPFFKMNPRVDDIPEKYCVEHEGIKLLVMGTMRQGGGGCACPENAFLKSLLSHLVLARDESVVLDMEAGIEHLGRGTAIGVDVMIAVAEPSLTSMETVTRIRKLAADIGIREILLVANKIEKEEQRLFVEKRADGIPIAGFIDYSEEIKSINSGSKTALTIDGPVIARINEILSRIGLGKK